MSKDVVIINSVFALLYLWYAYELARWAFSDAGVCGKSGWAVAAFVVLTFPLGLVAWALHRFRVTRVK